MHMPLSDQRQATSVLLAGVDRELSIIAYPVLHAMLEVASAQHACYGVIAVNANEMVGIY